MFPSRRAESVTLFNLFSRIQRLNGIQVDNLDLHDFKRFNIRIKQGNDIKILLASKESTFRTKSVILSNTHVSLL